MELILPEIKETSEESFVQDDIPFLDPFFGESEDQWENMMDSTEKKIKTKEGSTG